MLGLKHRAATHGLLLVLFVLFSMLSSTCAQQENGRSPSSSPESFANFDDQLAEAQHEILGQILHTRTKDDALLAAQFFAFHARLSTNLRNTFQQRIRDETFPESIAQQRELASKMDKFVASAKDYYRLNALHKERLARQRETFSMAMHGFPTADDAFHSLQQMIDQAELYKDLLIQNLRAAQRAQNLKDLDNLTKHRIYRVAQDIEPHI